MTNARRLQSAVAIAFLGGCSYYDATLPSDSVPPATNDGGSSGDLPCEVFELLSTYCLSCHSDPPAGGAPMSLSRRADLLAMSPTPGARQADRALARMSDQARPMPPGGVLGPNASEIASFQAWVDSGLPEGTCGGGTTGPDGGTGPQPTTCTSGDYFPVDYDDREGPDMNPGLPCRACHLEEEDDVAYFFMGSVYPFLHEEDRCYSNVPAGTEVHIIDRNNEIALRLPVRERGNFFSMSRQAQVQLPFTARVVTADGATIGMSTPQMTGDCNGCHTEQGANGAPGRILIPTL